MILLNFSHPLTEDHVRAIAALAGTDVETVIYHPTHFDAEQPFAEQARAAVDACGLSSEEWQTEALLIAPPALNVIAVTMLAEIHGRTGYFPAVLRLRRKEGTGPTRFEVAEIIDLDRQRSAARERR